MTAIEFMNGMKDCIEKGIIKARSEGDEMVFRTIWFGKSDYRLMALSLHLNIGNEIDEYFDYLLKRENVDYLALQLKS